MTTEKTNHMVDKIPEWEKSLREKLKDVKSAWDKDGNLITDRNEYLRSLPQHEDGEPMVDRDEFDEMSGHLGWEEDFVENYVIYCGLIEASDYEEFYQITD